MQSLLQALKQNDPSNTRPAPNTPAISPFSLLIADARRLQLETAMQGDFKTSARWATIAKNRQTQAKLATASAERAREPHQFVNQPTHQTVVLEHTPPRPRASTAATVAFSLLAGMAAVLAPTQDAAAQHAPMVHTAQVKLQTLQARHRVTGSLEAARQTELSMHETGAVRAVYFDAGDHVVKGQVIAVLDDRRTQAALAEAKAAVMTAEAAIAEQQAVLDLAQSDEAQIQSLLTHSAANQRELDNARRATRVAEAQLLSAQRLFEQASHRQALAEVRLQDTQVTAPYDAWVTERHVDAGDWIQPGRIVVTLVSAGAIEARLSVPERLAQQLNHHPESLTLQVAASSTTHTPNAVRISRSVDRRARTFPVIAELSNPQDTLTPGMSVTAWIPAGPQAEYLTVPVDALIQSGGNAHVLVVHGQDDGTTTDHVPVRVLFVADDRVAIETDGLNPTDQVVTEGNERLQPGSPIQVATPAPGKDSETFLGNESSTGSA